MVKWLGVVMLAACLLAHSAPLRAQGDPFPRTVIDAANRVVTAEAPARRVLVIERDPVVDWVVPSKLVTRREAAALDPAAVAGADLIVMPLWVAAAYPDIEALASQAGVPVFHTGSIDSVAAWRQAVNALGTITGQDARTARTLAWLDLQLAAITQRVDAAAPVRALVLTPEGYTYGSGTLLGELLEAAGALNVAGRFDDYRQISDEAIRGLAPDVVFLTPVWERSQIAALRSHDALITVPALLTGRVYRLPFHPLQPADPGAAALWLATRLHPARFALLTALQPGASRLAL